MLQTIGQAYDDMQSQNQQLLQQITERDDYNVKVNSVGPVNSAAFQKKQLSLCLPLFLPNLLWNNTNESPPLWLLFQLVLEGLRSRQMGDVLLVEKNMLEKSVHHTRKTVDVYEFKAGRIEDQVV